MRSLILAGGGVKVAYQAGCLQVLLDEAKLEFDHVDSASGGTMNAVMLFSGLSGTRIADNWRNLNPFDIVQFNWREYHKLFWARSIATLDRINARVFPAWGLDWEHVRATKKPYGTFNIYNFTDKRLDIFPNREMDAELLSAAIALPMWFPPVERDGKTYFDAVYCTDGNVGEAVRLGADEIWAIWTVADLPDYRDGFLAQYFHIIETVADTRFFQEWTEIQAVNQAIERHGMDGSRPLPDLQMREGYQAAGVDWRPPPGRKPIALHLIKQEVPVHYLLNASRDRLNQAVEMGVRDARDYCRKIGLLPPAPVTAPGGPEPPPPTEPIIEPPISLEFTEEMKGFFALGEEDPVEGERSGRAAGNRISFRLTIEVDDLDRFIEEPQHLARAGGWVDCPSLGGRMRVSEGSFNLFLIEDRGATDLPAIRRMEYRMRFACRDGTEYVLSGHKLARDDPGIDIWPDLTTLYAILHRRDGGSLTPIGAGVLHLHFLDFLKELTTFRVDDAPGPIEALAALNRFGQFFLGSAWDIYARHVIDYGPF